VSYVPYVAILIAFALVHLPRQLVSLEMRKLAGGYDNRDPRGQQQHLEGLGKRALGAHHNGFEAFAPFAVAILMCAQRGVNIDLVGWLAIGFVVVRTAYVAAYLADLSTLRSLLWALGMAATIALMIAAVVAPR
jgi:uncharacterized MAPEG superfamily protein